MDTKFIVETLMECNRFVLKYRTGKEILLCGEVTVSQKTIFIGFDKLRQVAISFSIRNIRCVLENKQSVILSMLDGTFVIGERLSCVDVPTDDISHLLFSDSNLYSKRGSRVIVSLEKVRTSPAQLVKLRNSQLLTKYKTSSAFRTLSSISIFYKIENGIIKGYGLCDAATGAPLTAVSTYPYKESLSGFDDLEGSLWLNLV